MDGSTPHEAAGEGVKLVDFNKLDLTAGRAPKLWLVEAKKSVPNVNSPNYSKVIKALAKRRDQVISDEHKRVIYTLMGLVETQGPILAPIILNDKAMRPAIGTWALGPDSIVVLHEDGARQSGFGSHHIFS